MHFSMCVYYAMQSKIFNLQGYLLLFFSVFVPFFIFGTIPTYMYSVVYSKLDAGTWYLFIDARFILFIFPQSTFENTPLKMRFGNKKKRHQRRISRPPPITIISPPIQRAPCRTLVKMKHVIWNYSI